MADEGRERLLAEIVARVSGPGERRLLLGVDGVDGAGKTTFADALAATAQRLGRPVVRVSIDDFHHVRAIRYRRGKDSPDGFWLDSYDYVRFAADVLDPLGPGGSGRYRSAAHDVDSDLVLDPAWLTAPPGAPVIVDGIFLHRNELFQRWDFSVFLEVPFAETAARMVQRDGSHPDPEHPSMRRYVEGQRLYLRSCQPHDRAGMVIDNTDPAAPVIVDMTARRSS